ncbi:multidrug transporter MATE [Sphingomonas sp. HMP9]|uniref:MATE family efflux transporter n=1 Tax=Sphingomonas sp. HMP9 TaxID=1517554 RepID=UPI00159AB862|nr:MATE family efflux transporter [Sphingomonas sp. HMP9]BCA63241.1 multidrug transporter MATE [Sphingomonas sp. HMP9]
MAAPRHSTNLRAETRRILALAWPVMLTSLNWTILHVTDVIVVGLVGVHEVAALGASRSLTFIAIVTGLAWLSGVLVHTARADGAGDLPRTGQVLREGLVLGLLLGLVVGGVMFVFADAMLAGIGVAPALVEPAGRVVRVMAFTYPPQLMIVAASFFLEGVSRPRRVAVVNLSILPFNAVLAWAMSGGHLGLPAMGAVGAATATAVASGLGAVGMIAAALTLPRAKERGVRRIDLAAWQGVPAGIATLAVFGIVPAVASGLELAGFSILIALSTQFGDDVAHAFQIVFSVHNVTFGVALGLGSACGVRVGNAVGEGNPTAGIARALIATGLSMLALGMCGIVLIVGRGPIVAAFPADIATHGTALAMLPVWAPFILFDGAQVVLVYALRSLGDQVVAGVNSIVAYFIVTGGAGWWMVHAGLGPMALVYASGLGMVTAALLHGVRFWIVSRRLRH